MENWLREEALIERRKEKTFHSDFPLFDKKIGKEKKDLVTTPPGSVRQMESTMMRMFLGIRVWRLLLLLLDLPTLEAGGTSSNGSKNQSL